MAVFDDWQSGNTFTAADEDEVAQAINGSGWLAPCRFATTGSETFTVSSGNVVQIAGTALDGGSPQVGDRVLVKDAPAASGAGSALSSQPGNGVYRITANASNLALTRVYEMSNSPPAVYVPSAFVVSVMGGTAAAGLSFIVTVPNSPVAFAYGTGNIKWAPLGYVIGSGLTLTGSTLALSATALADLGLAATSLQNATGVLTTSGTSAVVAAMGTGQVILGNGGVPNIATVSGDVSLGATGAVTIGNGAVTTAKMANLAANSLLGNATGSSAAPAAVALAQAATASAVALRDANADLLANSFVPGTATTTTAGGTTTLTAASAQFQQFTGTATQALVLPDATTLRPGQRYEVSNRSSAAVTAQANGGATLQAMAAGSQAVLTLVSNGTSAGTWDVAYTISGLVGTVTAVSVATANGFSGSSSGGATPQLTLATAVTGLLKGNGTAVSAAASGTDYAPATTGTSILKASSGGFANAVSGTDYAPATSGTSALKGNGAGGFAAATLNDVGTPTGNYSVGGFAITNVGTPTTSDQATNKGYVDALFQGATAKYSAEAATTGVETFTIVSGTVTQISGTAVDGASPNVGDYVLVKDAPAASGGGSVSSTQPGNGLYLVTANATNLSLSRASDMTGAINPVGAYCFVAAGTNNKGNGWIVTTPASSGSFTYGSGSIHWTQFTGAGAIVAGPGLFQSGNTIQVENSGVLTVAHGGTGAATLTGLVKGNGTGAFTAAASGTDYAPATTGSSILKGNGSGGFSSATSGTDYAPATSGSSILKGNGSGAFSNAASGTDYAPATSGSAALRANGSGGFASAVLGDVGTPTANYSMGGFGLTSVANPSASQDAATKLYVDSAPYHPSCRVATTGTETFTVVSGTVTTINGTSVDGVSVSSGDRVLVKDAPAATGTGTVLSSQSGNGIYTITSVATNIALSRVGDMSGGGSAATPAGSAVVVMAGAANASTSWKVASPASTAAFTYGTTAIQWTPDTNTGNVLTRSGNTVQVAPMSTGQAIVGNAGTPTVATLSGDVTVGATGTTTIAAAAVSLAKMANLAANSVIGNTSGSPAAPSAVSLLSTATAGAVALRDANANLAANSFIDASATVATAAGTTTLTVGSAPFQQFTGSTTQAVAMPNATTMAVGQAFTVANRSTGIVTVKDNAGTTLQAMAAATCAIFTLISNSGAAGTWDVTYIGAGAGSVNKYTNSSNPNSTTWTVTHNLGTQAVVWSLQTVSGNVFANVDAVATSTSVLTLTFQTAPAANSLTVTVMG